MRILLIATIIGACCRMGGANIDGIRNIVDFTKDKIMDIVVKVDAKDVLKKLPPIDADFKDQVDQLGEDVKKKATDIFNTTKFDKDIRSKVKAYDPLDKLSILREKLKDIALQCKSKDDNATIVCVEQKVRAAIERLGDIDFLDVNTTKLLKRFEKLIKKFVNMVMDIIESLKSDDIKECLTAMSSERAERVMKERLRQWLHACSRLRGDDAADKCRKYVQEKFMKQCGSKESDFFRLFSKSVIIKDLLRELLAGNLCTNMETCRGMIKQHFNGALAAFFGTDDSSKDVFEKIYNELSTDDIFETFEECKKAQGSTCLDDIENDDKNNGMSKKDIKHLLMKKASRQVDNIIQNCAKDNKKTWKECLQAGKDKLQKLGLKYKRRSLKISRGLEMAQSYHACIESQGCNKTVRDSLKKPCIKIVINASVAKKVPVDDAYDILTEALDRDHNNKRIAKREGCDKPDEGLTDEQKDRKRENSEQTVLEDTLNDCDEDTSTTEECWSTGKDEFEKNAKESKEKREKKWKHAKRQAAATLALDRVHDKCANLTKKECRQAARDMCEKLMDNDRSCWYWIQRMRLRKIIKRCKAEGLTKAECAKLVEDTAPEVTITDAVGDDEDFQDMYDKWMRKLQPGLNRRIHGMFTCNCELENQALVRIFENHLSERVTVETDKSRCKMIKYSSDSCVAKCAATVVKATKTEDIENEVKHLNKDSADTTTVPSSKIRGNSRRFLNSGSDIVDGVFSQGESDNIDETDNNNNNGVTTASVATTIIDDDIDGASSRSGINAISTLALLATGFVTAQVL